MLPLYEGRDHQVHKTQASWNEFRDQIVLHNLMLCKQGASFQDLTLEGVGIEFSISLVVSCSERREIRRQITASSSVRHELQDVSFLIGLR